MARNLTIVLPDRLGALASAAEALAAAGINIEGACGFRARPGETWGTFHVLVEDGGAARAAVEGAGFQVVDDREVLVVDVEDRVGELARIARQLADEGQNMDLLYLTPTMKLVVGLDSLRTAREGVNMMNSTYR